MVTTSGCDVCNKSSLSLLLLRPSTIAKSSLLAPVGAQTIAAEESAIADLVPNTTESRFALRLLRAGYVHVYVPNPPPGVKEWLVYRITDQADLVPEHHALFSQADSNMTCIRPGHISTGLKLLHIPQAHKISEVWLAYSANLWSKKLRASNKADPTVMQKVSISKGGKNTFAPTAERLKSQVLECGLKRLEISATSDQDFQFNSLAGQVDSLVTSLSSAAAKHPKTAGKELAVVLRDPVGVTVELNSLRVRRNEIIKSEFEKPEIKHPLLSSNTLLGLKKVVMSEATLKMYEDSVPLISAEEYKRRAWPSGTHSLSVTEADRVELLKGNAKELMPLRRQQLIERVPMVRVIYPDMEERAQELLKRKTEADWPKYARYYDEEARVAWLDSFNVRMQRDHYVPLERLEIDWFSSLTDERTVKYFNRHFDSDGEVGTLSKAIESVTFTAESASIHEPGPFTKGEVAERYVALLEKNVNDKDAILLRSMVGNVGSMFAALHTQLTGDPGADGMRDKTFDLLKGFSELTSVRNAMQSHGWIGHALALYSIGQLSAVSGAVANIASNKAGTSPTVKKVMHRIQALSLVQRALEFAVEGAIKGNAPKMPVMITMQVTADEALMAMDARPGQNVGISRSKVELHRASQTTLTLTLLTDTEAIKTAQGELSRITNNRLTGAVKIGNAATNAAASAIGKSAVLSKDVFLRLYNRQVTAASKAANVIRNTLPALSQKYSGTTIAGLAKTLDARLALASCIIQLIGIWNGVKALNSADSSSTRLDAAYGLLDSIAGFSGGALQLTAMYYEVGLVRRVAPELSVAAREGVVASSLKLNALRFAASATGIAGGALNFFASRKKYLDQKERGNLEAANLYGFSSIAFLGTAFTSMGQAVGVAASTLQARAVGGAVVRFAVRRLVTNAIITVGGVALTVSGVGLVLLGAGIALQVGAILLTPDDLQRWLGRSYFGQDGGYIFQGKRSDMFRKGDWKSEQEALEEIIAKAPIYKVVPS